MEKVKVTDEIDQEVLNIGLSRLVIFEKRSEQCKIPSTDISKSMIEKCEKKGVI